MHMPVERIRERPELSTATIMMLTSAAIEALDGYLAKPIRPSELDLVLKKYLMQKV
jgi:hypothetical protein